MLTIPIYPGTPTYGLWCDSCLLPSAYEVPIHALIASGVHHIGTTHRCTDCDRRAA